MSIEFQQSVDWVLFECQLRVSIEVIDWHSDSNTFSAHNLMAALKPSDNKSVKNYYWKKLTNRTC